MIDTATINKEPGGLAPDRKASERARRIYNDPLRMLPDEYYRDGDVRLFMERASGWIMEYCQGRLSRDPDLIGDFYLHFYERVPRCLDTYESRRHMPFTGFLATYLRREFYNFKRGRKGLVQEFNAPDFYGEREASQLNFPGNPDADLVARGFDRLGEIKQETRVALKLYYGMALDAGELRYFIEARGCYRRASDFLKDFHARRDRLRAKLDKLRDRVTHLTLLIHSADSDGDAHFSEQRRVWKRRLDQVLERRRSLYSLGELADLLGISRTALHRRIKRAITYLQKTNQETNA